MRSIAAACSCCFAVGGLVNLTRPLLGFLSSFRFFSAFPFLSFPFHLFATRLFFFFSLNSKHFSLLDSSSGFSVIFFPACKISLDSHRRLLTWIKRVICAVTLLRSMCVWMWQHRYDGADKGFSEIKRALWEEEASHADWRRASSFGLEWSLIEG